MAPDRALASSPFGLHRVVAPAGVLPQAARRLDTRPQLAPDEVRVAVERLNLDAASYRQLHDAHGGDPDRIRAAVVEIIKTRGKMHNPVTGSGGMLVGVVAEAGPASPLGLKPGDRIATLVSLTLTPLVITDGLARWDGASEQVPCDGYAILFGRSIAAVLPDDLPVPLALAVLDVCGAPALTSRVVASYAGAAALAHGGVPPEPSAALARMGGPQDPLTAARGDTARPGHTPDPDGPEPPAAVLPRGHTVRPGGTPDPDGPEPPAAVQASDPGSPGDAPGSAAARMPPSGTGGTADGARAAAAGRHVPGGGAAGVTVAIIGASGKSGSLSAAAARRAGAGRIIGVVPNHTEAAVLRSAGEGSAGEGASSRSGWPRHVLADEIVIADARDPVALAEAVARAGGPADVTVVCVDVPGCEGGAILATAQGGTVIFFSMATSFTAAALGAEGLAADVTMLIGNGYVPGHAGLALDLTRAEPAVRDLVGRRVAQ